MATNYGKPQTYTTFSGTSFTDSTDEAVTMTLTIEGDKLTPGCVMRVSGVGNSSAVNSTNTHTFKLRLGGLSGTVIASSGADNPTAGDNAQLEAEVLWQSVGIASTGAECHYWGRGMWDTTSATATVVSDTDVTTHATNADLTVVMTVDHSAASTGNVSIGKAMAVTIFPASA